MNALARGTPPTELPGLATRIWLRLLSWVTWGQPRCVCDSCLPA